MDAHEGSAPSFPVGLPSEALNQTNAALLRGNSTHDRAERNLRGVVEVALPVLRFVRSLRRIRHMVSDEQAQLQADVVSREHVLTRHEQRRLANVRGVEREVATPADVSASVEDFDEPTS